MKIPLHAGERYFEYMLTMLEKMCCLENSYAKAVVLTHQV